MKEVLIKLYGFEELNDKAKDKARDWWRRGDSFAWEAESRQSIEAYAKHFHVKLLDWSVDDCIYHYRTDAENANFRGMKLKDFKRDYMPTGYCLDCYMWEAFYDAFKATGDAKHAFFEGLDAGFRGWRDDMAYQLSDEYIEEYLVSNDYEFMEDGSRARY